MSEVKVDVVEDKQPFCVLTAGDESITLTRSEAIEAMNQLTGALGGIIQTDASGHPFWWFWSYGG